MAYASIAGRKLRAADSNPEAPERKVQRGSGSSDELVVDSAAPSWGQNIQKMMICMMGKIDGTADEILEVKPWRRTPRARPQKPALRSTFSVWKLTPSRRASTNCRADVPAEVNKMMRNAELSLLKLIENFKQDIEDNGIFAYGKKFATMGAVRFKTEEAMWTYLKHDNTSKCMNTDGHTLYVNRAEQGTSDDQARTKAVRTNRRRMLRLIVGVRRRPSETWVEYTQRATWRSEELAAKYRLTDWCDLQHKRKQQMMQKVQTMQSHRWPARILEWTPWFRTNSTISEGRPRKRWSDSKNL